MSKTEITFSENKTKDTALSVPCIKCNGATKHKVIGSLDKDGCEYDQAEGWSVEWEDHYQIIQCQGCESVSFRHTSWFSEDADPMNGDSGQTERLYPKRNTNEITAKSFYNVPSNLRRIYGELVDCFNNESPTLCAAGLRAIVEGICAQQGVVDGPVQVPAKGGGTQTKRKDNLEGRIAGLQEKGLLTQSSAQTLHEHRYLGNDAVHELARPSEDELRLAIEIIEHTLQQLYELPEKAEELRRATARRKK
jgi:hypothetical protein